METKDLPYAVGDKKFTGYFADGSAGKNAPGILVCHQGGGLTEHTKERARMLGELGYIAFALDLYGEVATGRDHAMRLMAGVRDPAILRERANAGFDLMRAQSNVDS